MATRTHGLFRRLDTPAADSAKGGCYIYHTSGPCIDTGVLIDFEGNLTLSLTAVREMAEVAGFSLNEEGEALEREVEFLRHELERVTADRDELAATLEGFALAIAKNEKATK